MRGCEQNREERAGAFEVKGRRGLGVLGRQAERTGKNSGFERLRSHLDQLAAQAACRTPKSSPSTAGSKAITPPLLGPYLFTEGSSYSTIIVKNLDSTSRPLQYLPSAIAEPLPSPTSPTTLQPVPLLSSTCPSSMQVEVAAKFHPSSSLAEDLEVALRGWSLKFGSVAEEGRWLVP